MNTQTLQPYFTKPQSMLSILGARWTWDQTRKLYWYKEVNLKFFLFIDKRAVIEVYDEVGKLAEWSPDTVFAQGDAGLYHHFTDMQQLKSEEQESAHAARMMENESRPFYHPVTLRLRG